MNSKYDKNDNFSLEIESDAIKNEPLLTQYRVTVKRT